jgi:hypothetical protein
MSSEQQNWTSLAGAVQRDAYDNSEVMSAVIAPPGATSVTVQFMSFETEEECDFVTISSCTAADCLQRSQLGKYSGSTIPDPLTSDTGIMLIQWETDGSVVYSGWSAHWSSIIAGGYFFNLSPNPSQPA